MNTSLAGRRALVCGASQGIGRAAALALAGEGAAITALARNEASLRALCDELPRAADPHHFLVVDLSDPEAAGRAVREDVAREPVQILLNNTGGPPPGPITAATAEAFRAAFDTLLLSSHALVQAVLPGMRQAQWGRIINIVSTSVREPIGGLGVSNTLRAATAGWAKTLSKEVGPDGITVNNILPGSTRTRRLETIIAGRARAADSTMEAVEQAMMAEIPLRRFARPEELGAAVAFLASPAAGYITGVSLPVDGGRLASI
ncbi:MAG: short-chain dehydrogenase [Gemmatimonadetes bacterium]|nr:MAG: short-chain dehydrogenase [Gemmatimonadota bacterium]